MSTAEVRIMLDDSEAGELARHEQTIESGFQSSYAALLAIRDGRLYRAEYATFEVYCEERWGITRRRAYQLIDAAKVAKDLCTSGTQMAPTERQIRPLVKIPQPERQAAWDEALATAPGGKITAKHVEAVAERYIEPKPSSEKVKQAVYAGINRIKAEESNRVVPSPAAKRPIDEPNPVSSKIDSRSIAENDAGLGGDQSVFGPADSNGTIWFENGFRRPGSAPKQPEPIPASEDSSADLNLDMQPEPPSDSTESWLSDLPLSSKLTGVCLRAFTIDAILFREMEEARGLFKHHAIRALNRAGRKSNRGAYAYRLLAFLKVDDPKHWKVCPRTEDGGCGGTGTVPLVGDCTKCRGRGYLIL